MRKIKEQLDVAKIVDRLNQDLQSENLLVSNNAWLCYKYAELLLNNRRNLLVLTSILFSELVIAYVVVTNTGGTQSEQLIPSVIFLLDILVFALTIRFTYTQRQYLNDNKSWFNRSLSDIGFRAPLTTRESLWLSGEIMRLVSIIPEEFQNEFDEKPKRDHLVRLTEDGELEEVWDGEYGDGESTLVNNQ